MSKDLNATLEQLARAHGIAEKGFGNFLETLAKLEEIERKIDRSVREALEPFADPRAMMRRQAN